MRESGGGFPGVRALGLDLPRAGVVQVSMNVEDWEAAALHEIVERIEAEAARRGAEVVGSELVGLMPAGAAVAAAGAMLRIDGFDASRVLELRLLAVAGFRLGRTRSGRCQPTRRTQMQKFDVARSRRCGRRRGSSPTSRAASCRARADSRLDRAAHPKQYDDATLKDKVESELFRDEHEVKGALRVNAQEGVVQLRGELPSLDLIDAPSRGRGRSTACRTSRACSIAQGPKRRMHHWPAAHLDGLDSPADRGPR